MTDSPAYRLPLDPKEQPLLDRLYVIRDKLALLKQDRSTYVKSQDVVAAYNELIEQVEALNAVRVNKRDEQNRVDIVLDDCFQLISLFFLTIGRNHEAPAVYSAVSTVKRLLDHLKEAGFYSGKDLDSIASHIKQWQQSVERGKADHSPHMMTLVEARINVCMHTLHELQESLSRLDPEMYGTYEQLVSILRSLSACNTRSKFPAKDVADFKQQILKIQDEIHGDASKRLQESGLPAEQLYAEKLAQLSLTDGGVRDGPTVVKGLLARCILWVEIIQEKQGRIDPHFDDTYNKLRSIRNQLEQMNLTHAWSLRETDLYSFQRQLDRIDEARVNGNFLDAEHRPADLHTQRTLLYLLRKCYAFIYQYIISSEPVSEALLPIYNQLLTLKRCLQEVKRSGGVDSPRELYPYSMKLNSIDNMKKDGKFMVGNDIPEGQGSVTSLLAECFEIAYELRTEAEENDASSEEEADRTGDGVLNDGSGAPSPLSTPPPPEKLDGVGGEGIAPS
ncbi:hypothetical protein K431DRAFT_305110 [Polychaeton citri CBS 116435]|uniref:Uncharacterized protein n=1 Tax=Polychaeton citri CBS 116435 TaxID=1314669 RepID=A0A9P4Q6U3_9PEZI|nr:hypothetical protein K431DRAFT_305110 [Polychaeton citri CBS 116435]